MPAAWPGISTIFISAWTTAKSRRIWKRRCVAQRFEETYRGQINIAGGPSADQLCAALDELESLSEQMDRPAVFAGLFHAAKTDDPKHGALLSRTREQRTLINKHLIFFDLEWIKLPDEVVNVLVAARRWRGIATIWNRNACGGRTI